eukprot:TRINITY_DN12103_c0_g2_i22.p1 TRINITY_DN12103_c0_g2~~TRINITY_DN12103_c0_g2_i22.p1  ORF type:complete len:560 (-),score=130.82 TRINITY_DN12103_c0_g2_i22:452-2131(-)
MEEYKILKVIGDGAYGVVSKAIHLKTNEVVAIKKMKKKFLSWEECINLREIKSLRKLNHPNVIRLKEVIRVNVYLHMVFEFAENNLYQLTKSRNSSFLEPEIKSIIQQTLFGISYIHKNGFFHRDLKPENLMANASPSGPIIKICDFGQAREIRSTPPYTEYIATRWYRAPECLLRSNVYSSPVDIFALGCIMAELYLGRPLFPGSSESDQLFKICSVLGTPTAATWPDGLRLGVKVGYQFPNFAATPLSSLITNASKEAIDLMAAMLQFDPQKRITAAKALAHPYFSSLPAATFAPIERKSSKRIPEFSAIITEGLLGRAKAPERREEKDNDSNKSITKYSLNDSLDSANHSKGFHKDGNEFLRPESLAKSSKSHNRLPQTDLDDVSDILNDHLYNPFESNEHSNKSRKKYLKLMRAEEEKKPSHSLWEEKIRELEVNPQESVKTRRPLNKKPLLGQSPSVVPPACDAVLSNESNFSYHKRHLGIGGNMNGGIAGAGLRAVMGDGYKKDASMAEIYVDSSRSGRRIDHPLYDQPTSMGIVPQLPMSKIQFSYGRYKYQ